MNAAVPEPRLAVMIVVEASWADTLGVVHLERACMEDKSAGGACLRMSRSLPVGARLGVQWRFEQFSGVVKYCRSDGEEFVLGIQRDREPLTEEHKTSSMGQGRKSTTSLERPVSTVAERRVEAQDQDAKGRDAESSASIGATGANRPGTKVAPGGATQTHAREQRNDRRISALDRQEAGTVIKREIAKPLEAIEEKKPMKRKWLDLASWNSKQEGPSVRSNGHAASNGSANGGIPPSHSPSTEKILAGFEAECDPGFAATLLGMDDVYLAAGVMQPRGRGVHKVIEMLGSDHIREASRQVKRAAVLMALEAAGVSVEQVHQDARSRQMALDAYEVEQKKQAEAQWGRRAEENKKIQEDMERAQAQYMARISRNLEAVAQEQAVFRNWQSLKSQELQRMNEAVELCVKPVAPEPALVPAAPEPVAILAEKAHAAVAAGGAEGGIKAI